MFSFLDAAADGGLGIAFTDRAGGVSTGGFSGFNFGRTDADDLPALRTNMALLRAELAIGPVVMVHQVHGSHVHVIDGTEELRADSWLGDRIAGQPAIPVADALVTTLSGVPLAIRVADCVPVLLADAKAGVIAAAHAGRAGLLGGVLQATVTVMRDRGASRITAWIGPHICGGCYEVPDGMAEQARHSDPRLHGWTRWGTAALDLGAGCQAVLESLDVVVQREDPCTLEHDARLFSHRGSNGRAGRQLGLIWRY